ncbi:MAG: glutathione S-transferase [Telmatospirillum sp.]|nr:glutathione S-transferase [Telmatospirillum sp.]
MKLRYSRTSPYVRKVVITAIETGLAGRIEHVLTDPWSPETDLPTHNPLGRVPALVTDDGVILYDSPVICDYLDSLHDGPRLIPAEGAARWTTLRHQALADGLLDASVAVRVETVMRPADRRWDTWIDRQRGAIQRGLDALEAEMPATGFTLGEITIVCALDYLDFRKPVENWREGRPRLAAWHGALSKRPSVASTRPSD